MQELKRTKNFVELEAENETDTLQESEINALWHLSDLLKDVIQLIEYEGRTESEKQ